MGAPMTQDGYLKISLLRILPSLGVGLGVFLGYERHEGIFYGTAAFLAVQSILGHIADLKREDWEDL